MKRIILLFILLLFCNIVFSQESSDYQHKRKTTVSISGEKFLINEFIVEMHEWQKKGLLAFTIVHQCFD